MVILLSVIAALVLGVLIVVLVEFSRAHARRRAGPASGGSVGDAHRLRASLRREVDLAQQAVTRAAADGVSVGELRQVVEEITGHANRLDQMLSVSTGVPAELRARHHKLTDVCTRIRTDLADADARRSSAALEDTLSRAQLGVEALQMEHGMPEDPTIAEIRQEAEKRRDIGQI
jgi:hypothetical protein